MCAEVNKQSEACDWWAEADAKQQLKIVFPFRISISHPDEIRRITKKYRDGMVLEWLCSRAFKIRLGLEQASNHRLRVHDRTILHRNDVPLHHQAKIDQCDDA